MNFGINMPTYYMFFLVSLVLAEICADVWVNKAPIRNKQSLFAANSAYQETIFACMIK